MNLKILLRVAVSSLLLAYSLNSSADQPSSYAINSYGNVLFQESSPTYGLGDQFVALNASTNSIFTPGPGGLAGFTPLNTSLFSVSDILDVTYMSFEGGHDVAVVKTAGGSYAINSYGNVLFQESSPTYGLGDQFVALNASTNSIFTPGPGGLAGFTPLNTSLFSVSDILDVTYMSFEGGHDVAVVKTAGGSYAINSYGNVLFQESSPTYGLGDQFVALNASTNSIFTPGPGGLAGFTPLNTSLFSVSDILDVTYMSFEGGHDVAVVSVSQVPEPEIYAMLLAGLGLLGFAARRRKLKQLPDLFK